MEPSCYACDGRGAIEKPCPKCQAIMNDQGAMGDYYDAYSPYEEDRLGFEEDSSYQCPHLLRCDECKYEEEYIVNIFDESKLDEFSE